MHHNREGIEEVVKIEEAWNSKEDIKKLIEYKNQ